MVNLQTDFKVISKNEQTNKQENSMMISILFMFKF